MAVIEITVKSVIDSIDSGIAIADSGYPELDRGEKTRVRNAIDSRMKSAIRNAEWENVSRLNEILNSFKNVSANRKPEIDPKLEIAQLIANHVSAISELISGNAAPDGMEPIDFVTEFGMSFEFDSNEFPEFPDANSEMVAKMVSKRISRKSPTNDIGEMISAVMAEMPLNEFVRVSEIRNKIREMGIAETDSSWDGRISARLFPANGNCTLPEFISPRRDFQIGNGQTRNGAMRVS